MMYNIWPGSCSIAVVTESTYFNFYDSDSTFISDAAAATEWAARRLGHPVQDIELTNENFISMFEESVSEYSAQVNANNIKEHMLMLEGSPTSSNLTGRLIRGGVGRIVQLAEPYGLEVGVGGDVDWKAGSIDIVENTQIYDLNSLWANVSESGNRIKIKRIFHERTPASSRYFDPWGIPTSPGIYGMGYIYGFGNAGTVGGAGTSYQLRPVYEDVLRMQAIELNDQIRRSGYSFELINNKIRLFPAPTTDFKLWFHYVVKQESEIGYVSSSLDSGLGKITDPSNVTYTTVTYSAVTSVGRQWIRRYFLALCKITLGGIRAKYPNIPIPNGEVSLDGEALRNEGNNDRDKLIEELRNMLELSGKKAQMQAKMDSEESLQKILSKIPAGIWVY